MKTDIETKNRKWGMDYNMLINNFFPKALAKGSCSNLPGPM